MNDLNIPPVKNARPGDTFYENLQPSQPSTMFLPPAEFIELPSHGLLYHNITDDPDILEKGGIRIRPMTVNEEKILSTTRLVKSGQALDMIFQNVIQSKGKNGAPLDASQLLSSDRVFIMLWLRSISYGNEYKFNIQCPSCQQRFEQAVDLSNHPVKEMDTTNPPREPFTFTLPFANYTLTYRLPRGVDEIELIKMGNAAKKVNQTDDSIVKRLHSLILKVEKDGQEIPTHQIGAFVESMIGGDASAFRQELEKVDAGIEDIKDIACPSCGYEFDSPIPITENFFRSTR